MESTIRWHKSYCSKPSITVKDGVPRCHMCDAISSDLVAPLVAQNQAKGGDISLPMDTLLGEANFWWPRSVPYRSPHRNANICSESCDDDREAATVSGKATEPSSVSPIYPWSLDSSHFRLIYITESRESSYPIHIRLKEYDLNDHPEYETASYVWGGEDANSALCKPIYVGRFWDAILTTSNCSALLHYLRQPEICRVIWLDAICINQADNIEKPAQISRMGDIYANCERVVAFFGEDLVSRSPRRCFRPRIDLQKSKFTDGTSLDEKKENTDFLAACAKSAGLSQDQLVKRKFLSRIWIVQELLLPQKAIIPLGNSEVICNREQTIRLVLRANQQGQDRSAISRSLSDLLRTTSHCYASDPRDQVYGLLGLFNPKDESCQLVADYSLSWRDCWLGTAAYLLLVEKNLAPLAHAVGENHSMNLPSWVPNFQDRGSWLDSIPTMCNEGPSPIIGTEDVKTKGSEGWLSEFLMYAAHELEIGSTRWANCGQKRNRLVHQEVPSTSSLESASVDSSNGALRLRALRVFDGPRRLTMEAEVSGFTSIWVRGQSSGAHFRITGLKRHVALDESYQLYIISCDGLDPRLSVNPFRNAHSSQAVLLVLTSVLSEMDSTVVSLQHCFWVYDIHFYSTHPLDTKLKWTERKTNTLHSLYRVLWNLNQQGTWFRDSFGWSSRNWIFPSVFPSRQAKVRDMLPLLIGISEPGGLWGASPDLSNLLCATAKRICPDFDPVIRDEYFYLTFKDDDKFGLWWWCHGRCLDSERRAEGFDDMLEMEYSYPTGQDEVKWTELKESDDIIWSENYPIIVRFSVEFVLSSMKATTLYHEMQIAREFSNLLNEDLLTFLDRSPQPEDRCVFLESWGRSLAEELGLVWKLETVSIM